MSYWKLLKPGDEHYDEGDDHDEAAPAAAAH
jgi:hypothetical protein